MSISMAENNPKPKLSISLTNQILIATAGGIAFGAFVGPWAENIKFIGDIFIRLIQMSVVLLVMTAVSAAIGNVDSKGAGKMSLHTFKWIISMTIVSAFVGLFLALTIKPGEGIIIDGAAAAVATPDASIKDTILGFFSTNIVSSMSSGAMIPCIVFAVIFGLAMGSYSRTTGNTIITEFIVSFNAVIMNIIKMVMKLAPIGIFCLLANVSGAIGFKVIIPMLKFLGALAIGDIILLLMYGPLTAMLTKVNPFKMPKKFAKLSIMSMTTTSSAICLPTKMEDSVTKFGVSRKVADFTGPITMSMNANGAVMCYVLAIFFMSQATGIVLEPFQMGMAILLSVLMCMGTIVVPGGMIIVYTFLASSMGLPLESVAILIGIDWFSGMFRTLLNNVVDVMIGMLVSDKLGEFDRDVYNDEKKAEYVQV
ncbi:dicarboxylate/amino acid:cation symporter [Photobacterium sp. DNB23_23_1]|uniref:Dicarboxylate/amino acid:cation symporter n=1 Tax=Photobacterium pectinilyticum TaxID=2906793 RepID=A0ABT1N467_9GAMM|nr:dicarboxylate/amino acid:cation symporter [Photobacterium sp. ZSDE20]MCQ1059533.1 dicarboxylate/amino acid:cation symporter [Photobacterium sp. ZSDE20]MDD1825396.1 dicarboxylate/amino acid:cation symporter [Photobacterium sp. ZSDE20]